MITINPSIIYVTLIFYTSLNNFVKWGELVRGTNDGGNSTNYSRRLAGTWSEEG
jgi:hypothetical protein